MKKVVLVLLICCTAIAMSWTGISLYSEAKAEDRVLEAFIATPFYNDGEVRRTREPDFEKTHPGLYAVTDGGDYLYWMKENGTLAYITAVDANHQTYSEEVLPDYHKEDAALAAEEWFDKAFFEEEKVFGNRKKIHAEDFNGGSYMVTAELLINNLPTGNSAFFAFAADGQLIVGTFVRNNMKPEDAGKEPAVSEEVAIELAKRAIDLDENSPFEKENITYNWDRVRVLETKLNVTERKREWIVLLEVPIEGVYEWGETEWAIWVFIDSESGKCSHIAYGK